MPCIETVCVKIILCDLIRRDETQNFKKEVSCGSIILHIQEKEKKGKKEKKNQAKLILNYQKYNEQNIFNNETIYIKPFFHTLKEYFTLFRN